MTRNELIKSKEYWIAKIQIDLYNQLETYMKTNDLNRAQLADQLGVTKGYISQVLNGEFDHKISKLVDLALAIGKVPEVNYVDLQEFILDDNSADKRSSYVFKAMIRVDQIQALPFTDDHESQLLTA